GGKPLPIRLPIQVCRSCPTFLQATDISFQSHLSPPIRYHPYAAGMIYAPYHPTKQARRAHLPIPGSPEYEHSSYKNYRLYPAQMHNLTAYSPIPKYPAGRDSKLHISLPPGPDPCYPNNSIVLPHVLPAAIGPTTPSHGPI